MVWIHRGRRSIYNTANAIALFTGIKDVSRAHDIDLCCFNGILVAIGDIVNCCKMNDDIRPYLPQGLFKVFTVPNIFLEEPAVRNGRYGRRSEGKIVIPIYFISILLKFLANRGAYEPVTAGD
jgi:hypothetical protein